MSLSHCLHYFFLLVLFIIILPQKGDIAQKANQASEQATDTQKNKRKGKTGKSPGNCQRFKSLVGKSI